VKSRWLWLILGTIALMALTVLPLWLRHRPDPRIEDLLSTFDNEIILAELPLLDDRALQALADELEHYDGWQPPTKVQNLLSQSFEEKLNASRSRAMERQHRSLRIMGLLGVRARPFISKIAALATNQGTIIATEATVALSLIQDTDPDTLTNFVPWIASAGPAQRFELAIRCAMAKTNPSPSLLPLLLKPLESSELKRGPERQSAARVIARYCPLASNAAPFLRMHLADADKRVRPNAAFALGFVAPEFADEAVAAMLEQTRTNNSWTGDHAHQLYARLGPAAHAAVPQLESELADPNLKMFHGAAAVALWRIRHEVSPRMVEALTWDIEHGVQRSQRWSLQALADIGPPATNAVPALQRMTNHPRVLLRQMATNALRSIAQPAAPSR
jgi:hypothetical protein